MQSLLQRCKTFLHSKIKKSISFMFDPSFIAMFLILRKYFFTKNIIKQIKWLSQSLVSQWLRDSLIRYLVVGTGKHESKLQLSIQRHQWMFYTVTLLRLTANIKLRSFNDLKCKSSRLSFMNVEQNIKSFWRLIVGRQIDCRSQNSNLEFPESNLQLS